LKHETRFAVRSAVGILMAVLVSYLIHPENIFWGALAAFLVMQTSKGTPAHQGWVMLLKLIVTIIIGFALSRYLAQPEWLILLLALYTFIFGVVIAIRQPENYYSLLKWALPPVILIMAALFAPSDQMVLANRLLLVFVGGVLGIFCMLVVLPDVPYAEFRQELAPILNALIRYSEALQHYVSHQTASQAKLDDLRGNIENIMQSHRGAYPEWVFETGFNLNLRASFRFVLVQLERITEAFFSLDYHVRQPLPEGVDEEVASQLAHVISKNAELLRIMRAFFAGENINENHENFTSDVTDVQNSLRSVLPESVELLDVSPQYVELAAIARDLVDIRELLLAVLAGLPMNDLTVTE
jgi:NADH:ubiquinone oxidoreductase subunit 6 (subunit J)